MTALSLFTGCGGLDLAAEAAGITVAGQCEIDKHCNKVLGYHWPDTPRWKDVRDITADSIRERIGAVDLIFGGFPCQPHSVAGRRKGSGDDRDLWPEIKRILREVKPRWFVGENVPGLLSNEAGHFFGGILRDLAALGYDASWGVWGARDVGATHKRDRVFIVAYRDGERELQSSGNVKNIGGRAGVSGCGGNMADSDGGGFAQRIGERDNCRESMGERREHPDAFSKAEGRGKRGLADANDAGLQIAGHEPEQHPLYAGNGAEHSGSNVGNVADAKSEQDRRILRSGVSPDVGTGSIMGDAECGGRCGKPRRRAGTEPADRCTWDERHPESGMGRSAYGLPAGLDFPGWPAGRGVEQYSYEPPRTVDGKSVRNRAQKIKMLGNAVVPAQAVILFEAIMENEGRIAV